MNLQKYTNKLLPSGFRSSSSIVKEEDRSRPEHNYYNCTELLSNRRTTPEVPPLNLYIYPVEVKMTETMGLGLFATRNVPKDTLLCWYDGVMTNDYLMNILISGKSGYLQDLSPPSGIGVNGRGAFTGRTISGFPAEYRKGGCAQLCNDASRDLKTYGNKKYWKKINVKSGKIEGCETMVFFALKNIRKGDQLFYHYGREYWENKKDETIAYKKCLDEVFLRYNFPEKLKKLLPTGHLAEDVLKRFKFFNMLYDIYVLNDIENWYGYLDIQVRKEKLIEMLEKKT